MILTQESFGQIIIPYGINLGEVLFDIVNGLGFVFLPFMVSMIVCVMKARAQGADEGSPAVLAVKTYEKSFISMLFVLVVFVIPWKGESEVSYKTFMCGMKGEDSALSILYTQRPEIGMAAANVRISNPELPLGMGFTNNVMVGAAEAMSSTVPCPPSLAQMEARLDAAYVPLQDEKLQANLEHFNDQCFSEAVERIQKATSTQQSTLAYPYDKKNNYFWGLNYRKAYDGTVMSNARQPLTFTIKDEEFRGVIRDKYKPSNYEEGAGFWEIHKTTKLSMSCTDAAQEYRLLLEDEVNNNHADKLETAYQSVSVLPVKDSSDMPYQMTKRDVTDNFVNQAFIDAITGKKRIVENTPNIAKPVTENYWINTVIKDLETGWDQAIGLLSGETDAYRATLVAGGLAWTNMQKASEQLNMYVIIPLIISVIMTIVYAASPLLIVISGYSWQMVFNIIFLTLYLSMTYYLLNVSFVFSNMLFMLSESFYGHFGIHSNAELALDFMAYALPGIVLLVWSAVGLIAGLKLGSFISALIGTASVAAAKQGFNTVSNAAMSSMPKGKGGHGSKRQVSQ